MDGEIEAEVPAEIVTPEVETPEAPVVEEAPEETVEEVKARLAKAEELANNYKIRAEKAEKKAKEPTAPQPTGLTTADVLAFAKADIHEDDTERVVKFAKDEGLSVKDALKSDELKAILAIRAEKRTTANAANISNVRRGPAKMTDEALVANASAGKLPDSDDEIARLVAAKLKQK